MNKELLRYIIETPMFVIVNSETNKSMNINEYTLRSIQLAIVKGELPHDRYWIDNFGTVIEFDEYGILSSTPMDVGITNKLGMEVFMTGKMTDLSIQLMQAKNMKAKTDFATKD